MQNVFENSHWALVDKPAGWLTTPARDKNDPRACLGLELQKQLGIQIFPVHRLDFEVSGLVLFAKNAEAHRVAQGWFERAEIHKIYQAQSLPGEGEPPSEWIEWRSHLLRGKRRAYASPEGKLSLTRARTTQVTEKVWHWELMPLTGRPHQLRFELARNGTPILGDKLYGAPLIKENQIALRAVQLDLNSVKESERMGLPADIVVDPLRWPQDE